MINFATTRVGGIRFIRIGRFTLSFCVSAEFRPFAAKPTRRQRRAANRHDMERLYRSINRASDSIASFKAYRAASFARLNPTCPASDYAACDYRDLATSGRTV